MAHPHKVSTKSGKNKILKTFKRGSPTDFGPFQRRMRVINNCHAELDGCEFCRGTRKSRCYKKTVESFSKEAHHGYSDSKEWKQEQERLNKERRLSLSKLTVVKY